MLDEAKRLNDESNNMQHDIQFKLQQIKYLKEEANSLKKQI